MTLVIQKPTGAKLNLLKTWQPMDADAAAYITAVETADGQALEERTKIAIDNFVLGCKADGIWSAIKASCILAGARTLAGALVPLVGTAPTNVGGLFVQADYNRKTGLVGDGSTKYLDSNRNNTTDPQDNRHLSIYASQKSAVVNRALIGTGGVTGRTRIYASNTTDLIVNCSNSANFVGAGGYLSGVGFFGLSRAASAAYTLRYSNLNIQINSPSASPASDPLTIFAGGGATLSSPRLSFYSIGESLDLAKLDARVTDLINAFGVAIP
jgi:hypothetical protein